MYIFSTDLEINTAEYKSAAAAVVYEVQRSKRKPSWDQKSRSGFRTEEPIHMMSHQRLASFPLGQHVVYGPINGSSAQGEEGRNRRLLTSSIDCPSILIRAIAIHYPLRKPLTDTTTMRPMIKKSNFKPRSRISEARIRAEREEANVRAAREAAAAAAAAASTAAASQRNALAAASTGPQCANKACTQPKVIDGVCQNCGVVADESNIVAEVQFGETSSGAAMVQGSYLAADQGGARSLGPGMRRSGGSDHRQKSLAEAKAIIQGYASRLRIAAQHVVDVAVRTFTLSSQHGFTQGRPLPMVCAACLYLACRQEKNHVMLLDLADLTQINVFRLGRAFKVLLSKVPTPGVDPVFPEDIIHRLAAKLEFGTDVTKVAEDALRLVYSMRRDWIVMGRRPSGICGACLLMAARMNNYRRTVREVVYVVKVTSHTIMERMKEFNETTTSKMTIDDFLAVDLRQSSALSHDPPSFYRNSEAYKQRKEERRKRKRPGTDTGDRDRNANRPNPAAAAIDSRPNDSTTPSESSGPDLSSVPTPADSYQRDKDGYLIPPVPPQITEKEPALRGAEDADFEGLVNEFGDALDAAEQQTDAKNGASSTSNTAYKPRGRPPKVPRPTLPINEEWEGDEEDIEDEISEIMNDPETREHAKAYGSAEQRARLHAMWALQNEPHKEVSMAPVVEEDEFADDPEVQNAILTPEEAKLKELLWVNENKDWLRESQQRMFQRKLDAGKPKRPRKRTKARPGEAQTSPAGTPMEAAQNVMKHHGMSKRINYDAISSLLGSGPGGSPAPTASGQASKASSTLGDAFREEEPPQDDVDDFSDLDVGEDGAQGGEEDYDDYGEEYDDYENPDMDEDDYGQGYDDDDELVGRTSMRHIGTIDTQQADCSSLLILS
ncbi:hypothetical protein ACRALDRAFT_210446 [Sodiomyces alcalophilus JCM 7366]|uniref:uncharacterized protein n=1 Tax=Sodiomyces alcalophilus JCM 7366 TaxID=591952 RepID=UPI0039B42662